MNRACRKSSRSSGRLSACIDVRLMQCKLRSQGARNIAIALAELGLTDMIVRRAARSFILQVRFIGLLLRYIYLQICYVYLHIRLVFLKIAGALLITWVEIEYFIKSLSNENRVILAACVAVSIYALALVMLIRI